LTKTRNGFVTNSSSTSYICEISGEVSEVVLDSIGHRDCGYVQCDNEHLFLEEFVLEDAEPTLTIEEMQQEILTTLQVDILFCKQRGYIDDLKCIEKQLK